MALPRPGVDLGVRRGAGTTSRGSRRTAPPACRARLGTAGTAPPTAPGRPVRRGRGPTRRRRRTSSQPSIREPCGSSRSRSSVLARRSTSCTRHPRIRVAPALIRASNCCRRVDLDDASAACHAGTLPIVVACTRRSRHGQPCSRMACLGWKRSPGLSQQLRQAARRGRRRGRETRTTGRRCGSRAAGTRRRGGCRRCRAPAEGRSRRAARPGPRCCTATGRRAPIRAAPALTIASRSCSKYDSDGRPVRAHLSQPWRRVTVDAR